MQLTLLSSLFFAITTTIVVSMAHAAPNLQSQSLMTSKTYPGFNRTCLRSPDCNFTPINSKEKVWLLCENRVCICDRNIYIPSAKPWGLRWVGEKCTIGRHGPCGESNGLRIGCQEGLTCDNETQKCVKDYPFQAKIEIEPKSAPITITTTPVTTIVTTPTVTTAFDTPTTMIITTPDELVVELRNSAPVEVRHFTRMCERSTDCQFKPSLESDRVWLACEDHTCACARFPNLADVKELEVTWNGTNCRVGLGGPCGEDDGIKISCLEGNFCLDQKCKAKARSVQLDQPCDADSDCQPGLSCKVTGFHFHPIKQCVT